MNIIISAATEMEWMPTKAFYIANSKLSAQHQILFHQSGVGMLATAVSLLQVVHQDKPDLIIQVGIAGAYDSTIPLATVGLIQQEVLADIGVEENKGWQDVFDLQLQHPNKPPFVEGMLPNDSIESFNFLQLPIFTGATVNTISTQPHRIEQILHKYQPQLESMEGAALHYVGRTLNIPFVQFRAVSNYVGERNKAHWQIQPAINALNQTLIDFVTCLNNDSFKIKM